MAAPIAPQLQAIFDAFQANGSPTITKPLAQSKADISASFNPKDAPQVGSSLPKFSLPNATGQTVTLKDLLGQPDTKGLLVIFYRGGWCPFCNIALRGFQQRLDEFTAAGVKLVAISPELPDQTLSTKEKNELLFEVLTDEGNKYAESLGIMWKLPDYIKPTLTAIGHDFMKINGNEDYTLPIPTNILVDKQGVVRNVFVEPDYSKRLEPATAVEWAKAL